VRHKNLMLAITLPFLHERYLTPEPCFTHATCVISRLSRNGINPLVNVDIEDPMSNPLKTN